MATKRVAKSSVDWAKFASCVPKGSEANFQTLRSKVDAYARKVTALPAAAPALDWDHYQAKIAKPGLAAEFKKQYTALNIPYPKDNANLLAEIDAEEKAALKEFQQFKDFATQISTTCQEQVKKWDEGVKWEDMTMEEMQERFPHFWPTEPKWFPNLSPEDLRPDDYEEVLKLEADIKKMKLERKAKLKGMLGMK